MKGVRKVYLDTNIFIMAFEKRDAIADILAELFTIDTANGPKFTTSELSLSELLVTPYRENNDSLIDNYENLMISSDWLEVLPAVAPTLRYAAVMRAQYSSLKLPDAIHLSTAIGAQCSHFLTADRGIKDQYSLTHVRYGITKRASPVTVLRPDEATLNSLIESLA
ncbi:type II toxin-antitoxin system VapC family toxin [Rhizobium puerariae]|uniref:Type II toxin-antitoxin system VapC family toxin n=1 Tax=Rhizobium puerariae TaxID=1585791 RepID=A0ABV6ALT7_9HYPH